jgi:hypothetical protein
MNNTFSFLLLCLATTAANAGSAPAPPNTAKLQVAQTSTTSECRNGDACAKIGAEDKQMIRAEQGRALRMKRRESANDHERWVDPIYSDSTRPDDLQLLLVKSTGLTMRLAPQLGILYFEHPGKVHAFKIAAAPREVDASCQKYSFKVISATPGHALINMNCPEFEYKANRSTMSSEYILYDVETATTKSIWLATTGKGEKFPYANPKPDVTVEKNGYHFQWTGIMPGTSGEKISLNNSFTVMRDPKSGKKYLECRDLRRQNQEQLDSEACEGRMLEASPEKNKQPP